MEREFFCEGLVSRPRPEIGLILVTGATGYVGGRLVPELLARGYRVRVLVRAGGAAEAERWPEAEIVVGDAADRSTLDAALRDVHTAYYLIHSLLIGPKNFAAADADNARNFKDVAEKNNVHRIIYLGGLGDKNSSLSPHLRSRMQVAEELQSSTKVSVTVLHAAIIIGSGSSSYEIIYHLVKRLPIIVLPYWTQTRCQPIAIRDVIRYLVGCLETPATRNKSFDIGGTEILTYETMMRQLADILGRHRLFLHCWISNINFYAYFAGFLTPVPAPIVRTLMEGLRDDVVCDGARLNVSIPFKPLSYRESIVEAISREEQDAVYTRWSDAYPPAHELAIKLHELKQPPRYTTIYSLATEKSPSALFQSVCRIGGKEGWFHGNWMWRLRGMLDCLLLGVGVVRGRRSYSTLRVNDVIDFWRVEDLIPNRRLLLRAEMKLPGRAWLEFRIEPEGRVNRLSVQPHYDTWTTFGRIYWYIFLPFHRYIFARLLVQIEKRAS